LSENVVYVGSKNVMNYVLACITQLNQGAKKIVLKARGKAISRAVDVAEVLRNRFSLGLEVKDVSIGTEKMQAPDGKEINVSAIEIVLEVKE